jgi:hypothetical protein
MSVGYGFLVMAQGPAIWLGAVRFQGNHKETRAHAAQEGVLGLLTYRQRLGAGPGEVLGYAVPHASPALQAGCRACESRE